MDRLRDNDAQQKAYTTDQLKALSETHCKDAESASAIFTVLSQLQNQCNRLREEQDAARKALENHQQRIEMLEKALDALPDSIYVKDLQSRFIFGNRAFHDWATQRGVEDIYGKTDIDVLGMERGQPYYDEEQDLLRDGSAYKNKLFDQFMPHEETPRYVLTSKAVLHDDETQEVIGLLGINRDVTNIKLTEAAFMETESRLQLIMENIEDAILLQDAEANTILYANPAFEVIWGHTVAELYENPRLLIETIHPFDREYVEEQIKTRRGQKYRTKHRIVRADSELRWVAMTYIPIIDEDGHHLYSTCILRDVTYFEESRQELMRMMVERQRVAILTDFIQNAAHKFRTPLAIINTKCYLLGRTDDPARRNMHLDGILQQTEVIVNLVDSLTTMIQLDGVKPIVQQVVNLNELIRGAVVSQKGVAERTGVRMQVRLQEYLPDITGAADELHLLLTKLLNNALIYNKPGGIVTVYTTLEDNAISLVVRDTGYGIDDESLPHIFDRFYQADVNHQYNGLGLGLAMVSRIAERHQWLIEVESELDVGTTFSITVPLQLKDNRHV